MVLAVAVFLYWHSHRSSNTTVPDTGQSSRKIDYSPATKADNASNNDRKGSSNPSTTLNNYQPPANTGSFSVTITRAGVNSSAQSLQVASIVNGITDGVCTLNVHKDGEPVITRAENVALQVNSYVCPVISVPLSDFPGKGNWNVSMTVESNGKTITADWAQNPVSLD